MRKMGLLAVSVFLFLAPAAWGSLSEDLFTEYNLDNYEAALSLARPAAEQGNVVASYILGRCYDEGWGVESNKTEAAKWYAATVESARPPAEQGDAAAQYVMGLLYFRGKGVPASDAEALVWYRKSAEQGYPFAQHNIGWFYENGRAVGQDFYEAVSWYRKAAQKGFAMSQYGLGYAYQNGRGSELNYNEAAAWYRRAAEQGLPMAQYQMGLMYEEGLVGLARDEQQALQWYRKAADKDYAPPARNYRAGDLWEDARATRFERKRQARASAVAAAPSVSREDMQAMIEAAAKKAAQAQNPAPSAPAAAKKIHSDVDKPKYKAAENPDNFAVVVGIEKYSSDLPDAQFAERDAQAVREHLIAMGYPPRNIAYLTGPKASVGSLKKNLESWLPNRVNENSTVFFYYSGHGSPDPQSGQAYLVPWDGDPQYLKDTAYPMKKVYEQLGALKAARVIVALDSCFSGLSGRSVLAKGVKPLVNKVDMGLSGRSKVISMTSSGGNEISGTMPDEGHGAFTYYFLKGLNGAAADKSGSVTVKALYDYVSPKVQDAASQENREQTPQLLPAVLGEKAGLRLR